MWGSALWSAYLGYEGLSRESPRSSSVQWLNCCDRRDDCDERTIFVEKPQHTIVYAVTNQHSIPRPIGIAFNE
ncbi:unnamed protein product [Toxocara canis]|uniref:Phospholipase A(2) n=1 Tax=Toxocara canis TaxID=6265 RepID=A0A183TZ64_TOXCA|nr:unnamed protein product [Toxocara canis]